MRKLENAITHIPSRQHRLNRAGRAKVAAGTRARDGRQTIGLAKAPARARHGLRGIRRAVGARAALLPIGAVGAVKSDLRGVVEGRKADGVVRNK